MWSWFFPKKCTEADAMHTLKYIRYTSDNDFFMKCVRDAMVEFPKIHCRILESFAEGDIMESNCGAVKNMMIEWPEDLAPIMAKLLKSQNVLAGMAMGTEKSTYNGNYYNLVKMQMGCTLGEFRKQLVEIKKLWDIVPRNYPQTIPYTICIHNEAINYKVTAPVIYTCYKDIIKMHEYMYDPVETPLNTPLTTPIWNYIKPRPLVIITANIGPQMNPPENVYLIFTESTKSWGTRIYPYFNEKGHSVIRNFMDFIQS